MPTVLVVDDEAAIRKLLRTSLEAQGLAVKDAPGAAEALDVMQHADIDVLLCDVRMPGHDGVWLARQVRSRFPAIAVVFVTGVNEMDPAVTLQPGVIGYLLKPFRRDDLKALIRCALLWRDSQPAPPSAAASMDLAALLAGPHIDGADPRLQ